MRRLLVTVSVIALFKLGGIEAYYKCSSYNKCGVGEGDCDKDVDCDDGLTCGENNCRGNQFNSKDDCCVAMSEEDSELDLVGAVDCLDISNKQKMEFIEAMKWTL